MTMQTGARERTIHAFEAVRRRVYIATVFVVLAQGALGAVFGMLLARVDHTGPWATAILATLGAIASALWAAGRVPETAAGRLIERRFPECRNVLVTAEELLAGS